MDREYFSKSQGSQRQSDNQSNGSRCPQRKYVGSMQCNNHTSNLSASMMERRALYQSSNLSDSKEMDTEYDAASANGFAMLGWPIRRCFVEHRQIKNSIKSIWVNLFKPQVVSIANAMRFVFRFKS